MHKSVKCFKRFMFEDSGDQEFIIFNTKLSKCGLECAIRICDGGTNIDLAGFTVPHEEDDAKLAPLRVLEDACAWMRQRVAEYRAMTPEQVAEICKDDEDEGPSMGEMRKRMAEIFGGK